MKETTTRGEGREGGAEIINILIRLNNLNAEKQIRKIEK